MACFMERLRQAEAEAVASEIADPWRLPLERAWPEKLATMASNELLRSCCSIFLSVPQHSRGAGACRRLAKLMAELGWMAVRVRGLTRGGYLEQVRGYCRQPMRRT